MRKIFTKEAANYTLYGALIGLCFPIVATLIEAHLSYGDFSWRSLWYSQSQSPLLWIIDTAPFMLGLFAYFIGKKIDDLIETKQEILRMQEQLLIQERMASIGQVTAGIAHDIKNPLNFVINFAETSQEIASEIREELEQQPFQLDPEALQELLTMVDDLKQNSIDIKNNGERANRIVHSIMDQTRNTKGRHEMIDLHELLDENLRLAYYSYRTRHPEFELTIQREYDNTSPNQIKGNPNSLSRVFLNLFNNACYALDQKQRHSSATYRPTLKLSTLLAAGFVEIRIHDNGLGIPESIQKRIFNPFFTTKPPGQGNTGLGLSISNDIIQQEHQGQLALESESGLFTEFQIRLPLGAPR